MIFMKLLVISDIHNDVENLIKFIEIIKEKLEFDVVIAIGDFVDVNLPKNFSNIDIGKLIIEELKMFDKPLLAIPGNFDKDLIDLFEKEGISLHGRGRIIKNVGFFGYGGAPTPFGTPLEPTEEELESNLRKAYENIKSSKFKVMVTHVPPFLTKLDLITSGLHVGSRSVRKVIEDLEPDVCLCSHIHEGRGIDQIKNTKILNSGRFSEGYCGIVNLNDEKIDVKLINLIDIM